MTHTVKDITVRLKVEGRKEQRMEFTTDGSTKRIKLQWIKL